MPMHPDPYGKLFGPLTCIFPTQPSCIRKKKTFFKLTKLISESKFRISKNLEILSPNAP
jgi:hypothetical protein